MRSAAGILAALAGGITVVAANQQSFKAGVDLVKLDVSVLRGGQPVRGLGPAYSRLITPCPAESRQDQLMTPEAILVIRPLEPGDAHRSGCPIHQFLIA